ncbi:MAG: carbonate dehydratase [Gammaproteobacteria bacterium]|nr:carbonate dehydratase [Gammaproteobacteria bacterium]
MGSYDHELDALLERNRTWAAGMTRSDPTFFARLAQQQTPRYLWIGCSDSRVPANQILGLMPGEIFVHRNVANVVVHTDLNCLSVIQFALEVLKVRHIIVCGHYGCSGVRAALHDLKLGLIDNWLRHVQDVRNRSREELQALPHDEARLARLCELNALAQGINVAESTLLQNAWARGQEVSVHSLIYGLDDGVLRKLAPSFDKPEDVAERKRELGW